MTNAIDPQAAPVLHADGSWSFPFAPGIVVEAGTDVPFQSGGQDFRTFRLYGDGAYFNGDVAVVHYTGCPVVIPDLAMPGTSASVGWALRTELCDVVAKAYQLRGDNVLAVALAEYSQPQSVLGHDTPLDLLGYEIVVLIGTAPAVAHGQVVKTSAFRVHPQYAQPAFIAFAPIGAIGFVALLVFVGVLVDVATGGKLHQAFGSMVASVGSATGNAIKPITQGPAIVVAAGAAVLLALGYFLNKQPEFGGKGLDTATSFGRSAGDLGESVSGVRGIERATDVSRRIRKV